MKKVRGEDAWRIDTRCIFCKTIITSSEEVYVIGAHVFHPECLEKLLSKPRDEFEDILTRLPLDTHEELRKLYSEKKQVVGVSNQLETQSQGQPQQEQSQNPPDERILSREERRELWELARRIVDEALREAGLKRPGEMRLDGLGPEYGGFILALRSRLEKLVKGKNLELRVETYAKGFGDTHIYVGGTYLYTWRPQFDTYVSSFWGWVKRVYNLLKTLAEENLVSPGGGHSTSSGRGTDQAMVEEIIKRAIVEMKKTPRIIR